jgi:hypothetical protein
MSDDIGQGHAIDRIWAVLQGPPSNEGIAAVMSPAGVLTCVGADKKNVEGFLAMLKARGHLGPDMYRLAEFRRVDQ